VTTSSLNIDKKGAMNPHQQQQKSFAPPTTQKSFSHVMSTQLSTTSPKDNPMQIDKTRFQPFMEQEK